MKKDEKQDIEAQKVPQPDVGVSEVKQTPPAPVPAPQTQTELAKPQGDSIEDYDTKTLMPLTLQHKLRMAKIMVESKLMPGGMDSPQKVCIALQMGHELGLSPMLAVNNIAVINGKPSLGTDLLVAIMRRHPDFAGMKIEDDGKEATVTVQRRLGDRIDEFVGTFSEEDAKTAGLTGKDSWKHYPKRMRKHRATAYACRDAFPDALAGMYTTEEVEAIEGEIVENRSQADVLFDTIIKTLEAEKDPDKRSLMARRAIDNNHDLTADQIGQIASYSPDKLNTKSEE